MTLPCTSGRRPCRVARPRAFATSARPRASSGAMSNQETPPALAADHARSSRSRAFRTSTSTIEVSSTTLAHALMFHSYRAKTSSVDPLVAREYDPRRSAVSNGRRPSREYADVDIQASASRLTFEDPGSIPGPATSPGFRLARARARAQPGACALRDPSKTLTARLSRSTCPCRGTHASGRGGVRGPNPAPQPRRRRSRCSRSGLPRRR